MHALLDHLERSGFDASPRALGLDEQGREVLSFVPGRVVHPDHDELVASDAALAEVLALVRRYHDLVAAFDPPPGAAWGENGRDPVGPGQLLCHNDLAPWNLVRRSGGGWAFVDWDLAAPGRRAWDLAWALLGFVPLLPHAAVPDDVVRRRLTVTRAAYGPDAYPADVLDVAVERCVHEAERIRTLGARTIEPYATLLRDGHGEVWAAAAEHVRSGLERWR